MATDLEYALMAGGAYITSRPDPINQFPIPGGSTKGVSFALLLEKPCHVAHALN